MEEAAQFLEKEATSRSGRRTGSRHPVGVSFSDLAVLNPAKAVLELYRSVCLAFGAVASVCSSLSAWAVERMAHALLSVCVVIYFDGFPHLKLARQFVAARIV